LIGNKSKTQKIKRTNILQQAVILMIALLLVSVSLVIPEKHVLAQSESEVKSEIEGIDRKLEEATSQYDSLIADIAAVDREISGIDTERDDLNRQLVELSDTINKRLADVYKYGDVSMFEVLVGSKTVEDLTDRLALLRRITYQDFQLLESVKQKRVLLDAKADELKAKRQERNRLLADLEAQKLSIQLDLKDRTSTLENIQANSSSSDQASDSASTPVQRPNLTRSEQGIATWYEFTGGMTAAHNSLPLGTMVRVTSLRDGREVWVEIVDRGIQGSAIIDLERVAFARIGDPDFDGICPVIIEW